MDDFLLRNLKRLANVNEQDPQVIADVVEKLSAQDDIIRVRSIQYTEVPY